MKLSRPALVVGGLVLYYLLFLRPVRTGAELAAAGWPVSVVGGVSLNTPVVPASPPRGGRRPLDTSLPTVIQ